MALAFLMSVRSKEVRSTSLAMIVRKVFRGGCPVPVGKKRHQRIVSRFIVSQDLRQQRTYKRTWNTRGVVA